MTEITKIGKWNIPTKLLDDYIRFSIIGDAYLMGTLQTPSGMAGNVAIGDYERRMRWSMTIQHLMEIHREICVALGIDYSEDINDEFYSAFHGYIEEKKRLKE